MPDRMPRCNYAPTEKSGISHWLRRSRTERAGLKEGIIPVGATVTIHGHRNRDANRFEVKTERVIWNGRTFNVYPDRK